MTELLTNPEPFTVSVKAGPPENAFVGEMLEIEGAGLLAALTANVRADELPPPGAGFTTVMESVPAEAPSLAGIDARRCGVLTKGVVELIPVKRSADPLMHP